MSGAMVLLVVLLVARWPRPTDVSALPVVALDGLEEPVAAQIREGLEAVRRDPHAGAAWGRLGMVLQNYEFLTEARACFARASRLSPAEPRWAHLHGWLLLPVDLSGAARQFELAAGAGGDAGAVSRLLLAGTLLDLGRVEEAARQYERLLRTQPDHGAAMLGLARAHADRHQFQKAAVLLQRCQSNQYVARQAFSLLAMIQRRQGHEADAVDAARQAAGLPLDRPWPDPYLTEADRLRVGFKASLDRVDARMAQGQAAEAQGLAERIVREYPRHAEAWLVLARARMQRPDCPGAEQALRRHLELAPDSINGHLELGNAFLCQERLPEAIAALQRALALKPDLGVAHYNLGLALARLGKGSEAVAALRAALRFSPDHLEAYLALAEVLLQAGDREQALELLRRARTLDSGDERVKGLLEQARRQ